MSRNTLQTCVILTECFSGEGVNCYGYKKGINLFHRIFNAIGVVSHKTLSL